MAVKIERGTSRLVHSTLAVADEIEFWTRPNFVDIPYSDNDVIYEVESSDRIDLLARRFYQRAKLWWVIAHANNIKDLPPELVPGSRIRIPDPFLVRKYVLV